MLECGGEVQQSTGFHDQQGTAMWHIGTVSQRFLASRLELVCRVGQPQGQQPSCLLTTQTAWAQYPIKAMACRHWGENTPTTSTPTELPQEVYIWTCGWSLAKELAFHPK
jgi:hypothetical protein